MERLEKPVFFTIKKELAQQIASGEKTHEGRPVDARGVSDVLFGSKVAFDYYRPERLICKFSEVEEFETVHESMTWWRPMATASYQRCQNHSGWPFGLIKYRLLFWRFGSFDEVPSQPQNIVFQFASDMNLSGPIPCTSLDLRARRWWPGN